MNSSSTASSASPTVRQFTAPLSAEEYQKLSIGDTVRYRSTFSRPIDPTTGQPVVGSDKYVNEQQRLNAEARGGDGGREGGGRLPTLLNRFDIIFFVVMFIGFALLLKFQYKVDVVPIVWRYIKPSYDEGVHDYWSWDGEGRQSRPEDLAIDGDL